VYLVDGGLEELGVLVGVGEEGLEGDLAEDV
jgi:hypothetical protein